MIKKTITILAFVITTTVSSSYAQNNVIESLDDFQWQHRIILIKQEVICNDQHSKILLNAKPAIDERHVLWFVICNEEVESNFTGTFNDTFTTSLKQDYFIRDDVNVILIGKDGGIKRRTDSLILDELFALIDSMPMRQSEMNR